MRHLKNDGEYNALLAIEETNHPTNLYIKPEYERLFLKLKWIKARIDDGFNVTDKGRRVLKFYIPLVSRDSKKPGAGPNSVQ